MKSMKISFPRLTSTWSLSENNLLSNFFSLTVQYTLTLEKYFTTLKNYVISDDQPGTWLCKLHANYISKSKTTGSQNTANEKSTI